MPSPAAKKGPEAAQARAPGRDLSPERAGAAWPPGPQARILDLHRRAGNAALGAVLGTAAGPREVIDPDPIRARETAILAEAIRSRLGVREPVPIHLDDVARDRLGARIAHGLFADGEIYIRPEGFFPTSAAGRYVLAHELVHVAQARLPAGPDVERWRAELEAAQIARALVWGAPFRAPVAALIGRTPAADEDAQVQDENKLLAAQLPSYSFDIGSFSMNFAPAEGAKFIPGIDRKLQGACIIVKAFVGPGYTPALAREIQIWLTNNGGFNVTGKLNEGPAAQDEKAPSFLVMHPLGRQFLRAFAAHQPPVKVALPAAQIATLEQAGDIDDMWREFTTYGSPFPGWYTKKIFTILMWHHRSLVEEYQKARGDEEAVTKLSIKVSDALDPANRTLTAVRRDPELTNHPVYRSIFRLPEPIAGKPEPKYPTVDANTQVNERMTWEFLLDCEAYKPQAEAARKDHAARKKYVDDFAARMQLRKIEVKGDVTLQEGVVHAIRDPVPSDLTAWPQLEPPFYDRALDIESTYTMHLHFRENIFEGFLREDYRWEVMKVPNDAWDKAEETAENLEKHGEDMGGFGRILGSRVRRDFKGAVADVKHSLFSIRNILGPPGMGPTTIAAASGALRIVGSVIRTALGKLFERPNEYTAVIKEPGVYVVRCIAYQEKTADMAIGRMPSVAYLPLWVRSLDDMTIKRLEAENIQREAGEALLDDIQERLKDKNLPEAERKKLEDRARQLVAENYADSESRLRSEQAKHRATLKDPEAGLSYYERKQIQERIDAIDTILKHRSGWITDLNQTPGVGSPLPLTAYFASRQNGQAFRLLLEAVELPTRKKGTFQFEILDSTAPKSGHKTSEVMDTRGDAIANGVKLLLYEAGYGRGTVTVAIPRGIWDLTAKQGETRTFEIERSETEIAIEFIENAALIASIAAIAAAPLTGGASLGLLLPIGIAGAIPSAYRLIDSAAQGTFEWDWATAMDIVNCISSIIPGARVAGTSLKLIRSTSKVWMIIGLGADGLGVLAGGADFLKNLTSLDPNMPEGLRTAEAMIIVGQGLIQIGIAVGAHMVAEGQARKKAATEAGKAPPTDPTIRRGGEDLHKPLVDAGFKDVPVLVDEKLGAIDVEVRFEKDGYGMPSELHVVCGKNATAAHVTGHLATVRMLNRLSGIAGWVRTLIDRFNAFLRGKPFKHPLSRGAIAFAEVTKLKGIIWDTAEKMRQGKIAEADGMAYIEDLKKQIAKHQQALNELEEGPKFIAAQTPVGVDAVKHGYPKPPENHYYVEEAPGKFQLRQYVGVEGKAKMVVSDGKGGWSIMDRPAEVGARPFGAAPVASSKASVPLDPAQLRADLVGALRIAPDQLDLHMGGDRVRVQPWEATNGKTYRVEIPPGATADQIESAIARHNELRAQRPADVSKIPTDARGNKLWNGALEAEYQGRPEPRSGDHWALHDGKLRYVNEDPNNRLRWDSTKDQLVKDTGPVAERWPKDVTTTRETAFEDLGGNDPKSDFGKWVAFVEEKLGVKRADLVSGLQDPTGLTHDTVRHNLKAQYEARILAALTDPAQLQTRYPDLFKGLTAADGAKWNAAVSKARLKAMIEARKGLGLKDGTAWSEKWYETLFAPGAESQVKFDKAKLNAAGIPTTETRVGDLVMDVQRPNPKDPKKPLKKKVIRDVKSHEGELGGHDKAQYADYKLMIDKDVPRTDESTTHVDEVTEVFLNPKGGAANAEFIAGELAKDQAVTFQVFNNSGVPHEFTRADFLRLKSAKALAAEIVSYCNGG